MKKILSIMIFGLTLIFGLNTKSQNSDRFSIIRERITYAKLHEIKLSLQLDQATFEKFRPIYIKYERETSKVDFRSLIRLLKVDADSLSANDAEILILKQIETAKLLVSIREKYYKEFKTVILPQQIIKLYQTEAELNKKVLIELKRRMIKMY